MCFLFDEKDFFAIIIHSKLKSEYVRLMDIASIKDPAFE